MGIFHFKFCCIVFYCIGLYVSIITQKYHSRILLKFSGKVRLRGVATGVYRYIYPPNQSTLNFLWLFCLLDPLIPTQIKFLATSLVRLGPSQRWLDCRRDLDLYSSPLRDNGNFRRIWCCHLANTTENWHSVGGGWRSLNALLVYLFTIVSSRQPIISAELHWLLHGGDRLELFDHWIDGVAGHGVIGDRRAARWRQQLFNSLAPTVVNSRHQCVVDKSRLLRYHIAH